MQPNVSKLSVLEYEVTVGAVLDTSTAEEVKPLRSKLLLATVGEARKGTVRTYEATPEVVPVPLPANKQNELVF